MENPQRVIDVAVAGIKKPLPVKSQSPAVSPTVAMLEICPDVKLTATLDVTFVETNSPTLPELAESLFAVPSS